jgi:hypothetical protein
MRNMIYLYFRVDAKTIYGETVKVVGEPEFLGHWDLQRALCLTYCGPSQNGCSRWAGYLIVDARKIGVKDFPLNFKYVVATNDDPSKAMSDSVVHIMIAYSISYFNLVV